jgi:hypothetical protein
MVLASGISVRMFYVATFVAGMLMGMVAALNWAL